MSWMNASLVQLLSTVKLERHTLREQFYIVVNNSRIVLYIRTTKKFRITRTHIWKSKSKFTHIKYMEAFSIYYFAQIWCPIACSGLLGMIYRDSCTCKCGTVLVCERNGCSDRDQSATHWRPTASCAVADRKNSTSVVVDMVDIVDSSHVTSVVVVVPFSCFLLVFGCRCFFLGLLAFFCFLLCLRFCFWMRVWQFLWRGGGLLSLPRCLRGGQCVCNGPFHCLVSVRAYADRLPSGRLTGICVRLAFPLLSRAKKVFFLLRIREYVL